MQESSWAIYLLTNSSGRTYIGSTTDVHRRLRQHNGEIRGGARSTKDKGPWKLDCYISGFGNRSAACRWERILKCRTRGAIKRRTSMMALTNRVCPPGRRYYDVPENLVYTIVMVCTP